MKVQLINQTTSESNLDILHDSATDYILSKKRGAEIISEVKTAMQPWRMEAQRLGLPKRERESRIQLFL